MADYSLNLSNAKLAVAYAQKVLKPGNYFFSSNKAALAVVHTRARIKNGRDNKDRLDRISEIASNCEKTGAGNCNEFAAVCFVWAKRRGIYPIDYMNLTKGNHAFVVIGRKLESDHTNVSTWGGDAVICDGWDNNAYQATWGSMVATLPGAAFPEYESTGRWNPLEEAQRDDGNRMA
jgi:hypothetical protein